MDKSFVALYVGISWGAVLCYVVATLGAAAGVVFDQSRGEKTGYLAAGLGLLLHSFAIIYWWQLVGHGPYMAQSEVLSSDSWVVMVSFLLFARLYPRIRPAAIVAYPSSFLLLALGQFYNPGIRTLPPTFRGIWLVIHISLYKVSLATLLVAFALSIFLLLKLKGRRGWLDRLPETALLDSYAYRFTGFGLIFWTIGMLAGSIWAYQSWGRFWGWDPVEVWSLMTWLSFGIYLHLRRFYSLQGRNAARLLIACFILSLIAKFITSHLGSSIHAEYFK